LPIEALMLKANLFHCTIGQKGNKNWRPFLIFCWRWLQTMKPSRMHYKNSKETKKSSLKFLLLFKHLPPNETHSTKRQTLVNLCRQPSILQSFK
jgi:hypothetical protein